MFGIGFTEIIIVAVIALLVFGPEKLPELTRKVGRFSGQLKRTSDQVRKEIYNSIHEPAQEITKEFSQTKRELLSVKTEVEKQKDINLTK